MGASDSSLGTSFNPRSSAKRCFGKYRCKKCSHVWMSANSWDGYYQECKKCKTQTYPYEQRPLDKPDGLDKSDPKKHHEAELCEKCKQLGRNCRGQ